MKNKIKILGSCALLVILDQIVKLWALSSLKGKDPIVLIQGVFEFRYIENRGAAFGIMQNQQIVFLIITVAVLAILAYLAKNIPQEPRFFWMKLCMCLIASGAVGNMIDRVFRKYVVDFIYFRLIDFPVFNIADIYVTCSAFLLVVLVMFYYKDEELNQVLGKGQKEEQDTKS